MKNFKSSISFNAGIGIQIATLSNVDAAQVSDLPDGKYTIPTKLKNASNIANDSMAAEH
ncbi:MAG: hypothetical protein ACLRQF_04995 [Thomasclavelia ramosa]